MNETITFYHNPMSRGRTVRWMLEEIEASYDTIILDWKKAENKSEAYLKINPMGKIPAIVHRGAAITETPAICMYLADAFPKSAMAPSIESADRGSYVRWFFFVAGCFEPALMDLSNPRSQKVEPTRAGHGKPDDVFNALELAIQNGYIAGSKFTAVDLYVAASLGFAMFTKQIEAKQIFVDYVNRCQDRPAYRRAIEQDGHFT